MAGSGAITGLLKHGCKVLEADRGIVGCLLAWIREHGGCVAAPSACSGLQTANRAAVRPVPAGSRKRFCWFLLSVAGTGVRWTGKTQRWSWRGNRTDLSWSETVRTPDTSWASASGRRESRTTRAWSTTEVRCTRLFTDTLFLFNEKFKFK